MKINANHLNQGQILLHYARALQNGDLETMEAILGLAEQDPVLDKMIAELDEKLLRRYAEDIVPVDYSNQFKPKENSMLSTHPPLQHPVKNFQHLGILAASFALVIIISTLIFAMNGGVKPSSLNTVASTPTIYAPPPPPVVQAYINDVWTKGNTEKLDDFVSQDHIVITGSYTIEENQEFVSFLKNIHAIFPELRFEIEETTYPDVNALNRVNTQVRIHLLLDDALLNDAPIPAIKFEFMGTFELVLNEEEKIVQTELRIDNQSLLKAIESDPVLVMLSPELLDAMQADEDFDPFVIFNMLFATFDVQVETGTSTGTGTINIETLEATYQAVKNIPLHADDMEFIDLPLPILPSKIIGLPDVSNGYTYTITDYEFLAEDSYLVVYITYTELDDESLAYQVALFYELSSPSDCAIALADLELNPVLTEDGAFVYQLGAEMVTIYTLEEYLELYCTE